MMHLPPTVFVLIKIQFLFTNFYRNITIRTSIITVPDHVNIKYRLVTLAKQRLLYIKVLQ